MNISNSFIIASANQKGGVGKTTTTINLAQALALQKQRILVVDLDPQANATQGMGINLEAVKYSVADLIRERSLSTELALHQGEGIDLIPSSPLLARVEREMVGITNSEMRLVQRLSQLKKHYSIILLDTPPTFGPLMNTAFSAADFLIIPVDAGFFALMGIKELLAEVSEIKTATNQRLKVLGYLLTLADHTKMTEETWDGLISSFGKQVFETKIRRTVKLREAPAIGKTIFHHDPEGAGSQDYFSLAQEVLTRLTQMNYIAEKNEVNIHNSQPNQTPVLSLVSEVGHG